MDFAECISATTTTTAAATATDRRLLPPPPPLPLLLLPIATWLPYLTSEPRKNPWTSRPDGCAAFFDLTVVQHSASLYTCNESRHHPPDVSNMLLPATGERRHSPTCCSLSTTQVQPHVLDTALKLEDAFAKLSQLSRVNHRLAAAKAPSTTLVSAQMLSGATHPHSPRSRMRSSSHLRAFIGSMAHMQAMLIRTVPTFAHNCVLKILLTRPQPRFGEAYLDCSGGLRFRGGIRAYLP